jgi:amino acid transporter
MCSALQQLTICRKHNGHSLDELPYQAALGVWGSYGCVLINVLALAASFYVALYPVGKPGLVAESFFIAYLAGPLLVFLYFVWKVWSWFKRPADRPIWVATKDIDIYSGMRSSIQDLSPEGRRASIEAMERVEKPKGVKGHVMGVVRSVF